MTHPSWNDWMAWVAGPADADSAAMEQHLAQCASCRADVETLRRLQAAGAVGPWVTPPDALLDEVISQTRQAPPPIASVEGEPVEWELVDMRGADAAAAGEALFLARSLPGYQLSLMVEPPGADRKWTIEGRLWAESPATEPPVRVVFLQDDHVLVDLQVELGSSFSIRELADSGWSLELHVAPGRTFFIDDPFV